MKKVIAFIQKNFFLVIITVLLVLILLDVIFTLIINRNNEQQGNITSSSSSSSSPNSNINISDKRITDGGNISSNASLPKPDLKNQLKFIFPIRTPSYEADYLPYDSKTKPIIIMINLKTDSGQVDFQNLISKYSYNATDFQFAYNE